MASNQVAKDISTGQGLYREEFEHDACGIGAIAHLKGQKSHQLLDNALTLLVNLEHRGGKGLESNTGDGAGILFQIPHRFFRKEAQKCGHLLPDEGEYGVAMVFFPQDAEGAQVACRVFEEGCAEQGIPLLFWREVPIDPHDLGETALACMPTIYQAFLGRPADVARGRRVRAQALRVPPLHREDAQRAHHVARGQDLLRVLDELRAPSCTRACSLPPRCATSTCDLNDAAAESALALVHSRYSTNTTPQLGARPSPTATSSTTARSTRCAATSTGFAPASPSLYSPVLGRGP